MESDRFEWDDQKAVLTLIRRDLSFAYAATIFDDSAGIEAPDLRRDYGEADSGSLAGLGTARFWQSSSRSGANGFELFPPGWRTKRKGIFMLKRDKTSDAERPMPPPPQSEAEIEAQAASDEENPPWTDEEMERAKLLPRVRVVRRALQLTQEEFAERYMIPVQTLRAWEQGVTAPDAAGRAYIRAIIGDADGVARALRAKAPVPAA